MGCGVAALSVLFLATPTSLRAQAVAIGQVSGVVTDPSGSAISNAAVMMTEIEKQTVRSTLSDSSGLYT